MNVTLLRDVIFTAGVVFDDLSTSQLAKAGSSSRARSPASARLACEPPSAACLALYSFGAVFRGEVFTQMSRQRLCRP